MILIEFVMTPYAWIKLRYPFYVKKRQQQQHDNESH